MKHHLRLLALLTSLALTAPAQAQLGIVDPAEATSAILFAGKNAALVRGLRQVPSVGVIRINEGSTARFNRWDDEVGGLRIYAEKNAFAISQLRVALSRNPVTRAALADHGVAIGRIVGVQVGASGSLRVFVD